MKVELELFVNVEGEPLVCSASRVVEMPFAPFPGLYIDDRRVATVFYDSATGEITARLGREDHAAESFAGLAEHGWTLHR